ncbi:MAG: limonene 1,2-monooxygenase [Pseudonocardiales bacterium]|jgi:limonene 1,2-monooxygenase|uniref:LLM class flavin-dependent oxidoreductase n=1 Tax=Pseudonocardia sp. Cha107L01 TaxID=3457576 RepID=UPI0028C9583B|nr:limonene 1,2-monooxygenase [Pseudonocardiales bacterium]
MSRLRFGIFLAPFHPAGENPTLALQRDLRLVEHLDQCGYDEAWIGEHHSAGSEIIASPEIFIAAAAERTKNIKLGTGVTSLSYHNPLWVAERLVLLDHLTRGRVMLGVGPGSLPTDSAMIGLNPTQTRELLETNLDVVMRLLTSDEPVTVDTGTHRLVNAQLHLRPYSDPHFDVAVAAVASPTGPRLAGKHGVGLLSIGATLTSDGFDALAHHWNVMEERAAAFNTTVNRDKWRLVGLMHIAETREQAYKEVEHGIEQWFNYFQKVAAFPQMDVGSGGDLKAMIDFINESGTGAIGTVEDAKAQVQRLVDQSGGFGAFLLLAHEWANPEATRRSYELIAQHVMPEFQGQAQATRNAKQRASDTRTGHAEQQNLAVAHMTEKYQKELANKEGQGS